MKIKTVCQLTNLSADTIRYYEKIGLLPEIKRDRAGIRDFNQRDVDTLNFIRCFRQAGMSVETLSAYMNLVRQGQETLSERVALLTKERELLAQRLSDLQAALNQLDYKIDHYQEQILPHEKRLFEKGQ
ncbi:MerR family transcriptional regulator [Streptococcus cuniculipharyngis]|uniref:MerR family transcriptional regulator n=1 Tax=Streptococcus cuniculipharyngis TaxID=1562651 RepID=A0A5C5SFN0_9STRE|nr:MerR family transcriptional regulator [Streptococcus cuniculipharyngis]TWS98938.1 MerR family transcriptional regulator [Streptococcus cuniculipharyngis]